MQFITFVVACGVTFGAAGVPQLGEMRTEWLEVAELAQMPTVHNFHEMAACTPDIIGVHYNPGDQLYDVPSGPRWSRYRSLPRVKLSINGKPIDCEECCWAPYEALRRTSVDGLEVESAVRLPFEALGVLHEVSFTNRHERSQSIALEMLVPGDRLGNADNATTSGRSERFKIDYAFAFVARPATSQSIPGERATTSVAWNLNIAAGETAVLRFVMAVGEKHAEEDLSGTSQRAQRLATDFQHLWDEAREQWEQRWQDAFTPNNGHFSGHLPVLETEDRAIRNIYYRSALTLLVLHRTNLAQSDRAFITSGERAKGIVFFWDTSMWSTVFALLEPKGMKEQLRLILGCNPHSGCAISLDDGRQALGWYGANDSTMFKLAIDYLAVTGDTDFLEERINEMTVLELLEKLATNWRRLQRDKSVMLADYGENLNLLECAPAYVHRVPSFNSANVWMMRTVANLLETRGGKQRAAELRQAADAVAEEVLRLCKPGDGVWHALHRDGKRVELRHCFDFATIGRYMADDLPEQVRAEMVEFVQRELLTDTWMRAMSPQDPAAAISDRPDHGPLGAFDAWPAMTAETMWLLGARQPAIEFLRSTNEVLDEGVYAQAREFYGPRRYESDAPVRIAMREVCLRECSGGGAFAETIVRVIFGFTPDPVNGLRWLDKDVSRSVTGTLRNVRWQGQLIDLCLDENGLSPRTSDAAKTVAPGGD